jgi:hypothetical protein
MKIEAGRSGREGYLKLDSQVTKGTAPPGLTTLDVDHTIYLGKSLKSNNDYSWILYSSVSQPVSCQIFKCQMKVCKTTIFSLFWSLFNMKIIVLQAKKG